LAADYQATQKKQEVSSLVDVRRRLRALLQQLRHPLLEQLVAVAGAEQQFVHVNFAPNELERLPGLTFFALFPGAHLRSVMTR
jgi:hypothetical protein